MQVYPGNDSHAKKLLKSLFLVNKIIWQRSTDTNNCRWVAMLTRLTDYFVPFRSCQSPTSPETHAAPVQRRRVNSRSPDLPPHTPPSPSTPPFIQATPTNGCSPSEHERGPRCRADGEARLCPELPLFPCSHQVSATLQVTLAGTTRE